MSLKKVFRQTFHKPNVEISGWFARHMYRSFLQMQSKLKSVDCIIEIHDARIPFSGRNFAFQKMLTAIKPHLLVLNKADLADPRMFEHISAHHTNRDVNHVLFTNCKDDNDVGMKKLIPTVVDLIKSSQRFNREEVNEFNLMAIGVPNVGKSSLINRLRNKYLKKGKATQVGALPGVTQSVLNRIMVSVDPPIYLLDTPGISPPKIRNFEIGLRLGLCAILRQESVGANLLADYLLFWLNKHNNFSYVEYMGMDEPSDNIAEVLLKCALKHEKIRPSTHLGRRCLMPDLEFSETYFIKGFQTGAFGRCILDDDKF